MIDSLLYDLRFAARSLTRHPAFSAVAIFSLALGIAINVAVFSVMNAILLPPLGVPDELRLVFVGKPSLTHDQQAALREALAPYGDVLAFSYQGGMAAGDDGGRVPVEVVSDRYFSALGLHPTAGRLFAPGDESLPDGERGVVLSHGLWTRRFGSDPGVVGQTIPLGPSKVRVLGVGPRRFRGISPVFSTDLWLVASRGEATRPDAPAAWNAFLRPHAHVTPEEGRTAAEIAVRRLPGLDPEASRDVRVTTARHLASLVWLIVSLFMLIPGIVLMVACANVSGLLASRSEERREEMAVRLAVGGSRKRLVQQLLAEGGLLSLAAAGFGLLLSSWIVSGVSPWLLPVLANYSMFPEFTLDWRVVAFSLFCGVAAAVGSSLLPALAASRTDLASLLKREPAHWGGRRRLALRNVLVVAQLVVTFAFLTAASLCVQGIRQGVSAAFGFAPERLLAVTFFFGADARRNPGAFFEAVIADAQRIPGVKRATLAATAPGVEVLRMAARLPGDDTGTARPREVAYNQVRPEYFEVAGTRILRGRLFDEHDVRSGRRVVVVSATMARRFWGADDPVGRSLTLGKSATVAEVVGVVDDAVQLATIDLLPGSSGAPFLYLPLSPDAFGIPFSGTLLLEGYADAARLGPDVERVLRGRPDVAVTEKATVAALNRRGLIQYEIFSTLLVLLGAVSAVLGTIGLYAIIARSVERRTHEIGVRVALGASPADVVRLVLRSGLLLAGAGVALGVPASFVAERMLRHGIFGVPPLAFGTLAAMATLVVSVALIASYVPARRATRVDPVVALRHE